MNIRSQGLSISLFFLLVHNRTFDREFVNDYFMESVTTKLRSTYYLFIVIPHLRKWGANGITWNIRTYHFSYKISLLILAQFFHPNSFQFVICDHPSFPVRTKIGTHILWIECFISLFHFYLECWWRVCSCVNLVVVVWKMKMVEEVFFSSLNYTINLTRRHFSCSLFVLQRGSKGATMMAVPRHFSDWKCAPHCDDRITIGAHNGKSMIEFSRNNMHRFFSKHHVLAVVKAKKRIWTERTKKNVSLPDCNTRLIDTFLPDKSIHKIKARRTRVERMLNGQRRNQEHFGAQKYELFLTNVRRCTQHDFC